MDRRRPPASHWDERDMGTLARRRTAGANGSAALSAEPVTLVLVPPMPRHSVLRVMMLGFGLMILLVLGAAYVGSQASHNIRILAACLLAAVAGSAVTIWIT